MKPPSGMNNYQWAVQCNEKTKSLSLSSNVRSNLLVSQWVMSGLIHPHEAISEFIQEGIVQESSVYQHLLETTGKERYQEGLQKGTELGARQNALESLYNVLEHQFNSITVRMLRPLLEEIGDIQVLKQLHNKALQSQSREDFIQYLERIENKSKQV